MNDFIELRLIMQLILRRWWLVLIGVIGAAFLGYTLSTLQTPVYQSATTLIVGRSIQPTAANVNYWSDIQTELQLAVLYADIGRRQPVLQGVVDQLGLDISWQQLREQVRIEPLQSTQLLEVRVEASDPEQSRLIADTLAHQLILESPTNRDSVAAMEATEFAQERLSTLRNKIDDGQQQIETLEATLVNTTDAATVSAIQEEIATLDTVVSRWESNYAQLLNSTGQSQAVNDLTIIEPAQTPSVPILPRILLNTIIAGILGGFVMLGLIFLLEFLNNRIRTPEELIRYTHLSLLGVIGTLRGKKLPDLLLFNQGANAPIAEGYRFLRSKLQLGAPQSNSTTFLITSAERGDGKSVLVANLAMVCAEAGYRTIVVDGNLRQPVQHTIFQLPNKAGLTNLLQRAELNTIHALQNTLNPNLKILTSGSLPPNPSELLSSQRMHQVLSDLKEVADIVLCDSPEALTVADATILSNRVDGVLVVVKAKQTQIETTKQLMVNLQDAHANLIGVVFNQFQAPGNIWHLPASVQSDAKKNSTTVPVPDRAVAA